MNLKTNKTKIHKCCNCKRDLQESGPINAVLQRLLDVTDQSFTSNLFANGSFEITERGWRARFVKSKKNDDDLEVTIYCYHCDTICEY